MQKLSRKTDTQLRRSVVWKVFSHKERESHAESRRVSAFLALSLSLSLSRSLTVAPSASVSLALRVLCVLSMHQSVNWFTTITKATHFLVVWLHKMSHKSPLRLLFFPPFVLYSNFIVKYTLRLLVESDLHSIQKSKHISGRTYLCLSGTARVSRPYYFYS